MIERRDEDEFLEWTSAVMEEDETMRLRDEDGGWERNGQEHLVRIGCSVDFHEWRFQVSRRSP